MTGFSGLVSLDNLMRFVLGETWLSSGGLACSWTCYVRWGLKPGAIHSHLDVVRMQIMNNKRYRAGEHSDRRRQCGNREDEQRWIDAHRSHGRRREGNGTVSGLCRAKRLSNHHEDAKALPLSHRGLAQRMSPLVR